MNKLSGEEELGISCRQPAESSALAGAIQNRDFQALQCELLITDLFERRDAKRKGLS